MWDTVRGTEQRFGCRLCHFLLGEGDPWDPPSVANGQNAHTHAHSAAHKEAAKHRDDVHINNLRS